MDDIGAEEAEDTAAPPQEKRPASSVSRTR